MFFFSSRRRHTRSLCDWSSDVCSSDLVPLDVGGKFPGHVHRAVRVDPPGAFFDAGKLECQQRRSEERRVGKECRYRWTPYDAKKKEVRKDEYRQPQPHNATSVTYDYYY